MSAQQVAARRRNKLLELYRLSWDPLLTADGSDVQNNGLQTFLEANSIEKGEIFKVSSLPLVSSGVSFKEALIRLICNDVCHPAPDDDNEAPAPDGKSATVEPSGRARSEQIAPTIPQKRGLDHDRKDRHYRPHLPARLLTNRQHRALSAVASLKSQGEAMEEQLREFQSRDIVDLEILLMPEHYPTSAHHVSSLAELYYLTQTLPLVKLLPGCHKTLMTENFELALLEGKIAVLYLRIEELKRQGKWLMRQPEKHKDAFLHPEKQQKPRQLHWDYVVSEGKWMAADFKELSKFRRAGCVALAQAVSDYWLYGKVMCVRRRKIRHLGEKREEVEPEEASEAAKVEPIGVEMASGLGGKDQRLAETTDVKMEDAELAELSAPAVAKHGMKAEDEPEAEPGPVQESEEKAEEAHTGEAAEEPEAELSAIDVKLLLERLRPEDEIAPPVLPEFTQEDLGRLGKNAELNLPFKLHADVSSMKKLDQSIIKTLPKFSAFGDGGPCPLRPGEPPLVPISRLLHPFEDDEGWYKIVLKEADVSNKVRAPPEYQKGLFGFLSHRRFNHLKPPKPPQLKNIEFRSPTIWLPQDDRHLIHYVAEFCFNWDLILSHLLSQLSTLKRYELNIETRTPWQCFERYIQLNEKFQFSDMKGVYAYNAQQWLEQAHREQLTTKRRISPLGVGNELIQRGHRRLRWASMFDAMRKSIRKRENHLAKINLRKSAGTDCTAPSATQPANTAPQSSGSSLPVDRVPTPAELSKLKYERDKSIQETYVNQQATRSRMVAAVAQRRPGDPRAGSSGGSATNASGAAPNSSGAQGSTTGPPMRDLGSSDAPPPPKEPNYGSPGPVPRPASGTPDEPKLQTPAKIPVSASGAPYTQEQIQQLLEMQKQRRMLQQNNVQNRGNYPVRLSPNANTGDMNQVQSPTGQVGGQLPLRIYQQAMVRQQPMRMPQQTPRLPPQASQAVSQVPVPVQGQGPAQAQAQAQAMSQLQRPKRFQFAPAQVLAIINSIQTKNPNLTKDQVTKLAASYLANIQQQQQSRMHQQPGPQHGQPQNTAPLLLQAKIANLTPQEHSQLMMLKAAKQQQQQLPPQPPQPPQSTGQPQNSGIPGQFRQQPAPHHLPHGSPQVLSSTSLPVVSAGPSPVMQNRLLDAHLLLRLQYEEKKKLLIQKHQHQQQQRTQLSSPMMGLSFDREDPSV